MRHCDLALLALSLVGQGAAPSLHAQWMQTDGPVGRGLTSFTPLHGSIVACDGGGIFLSADDGLHWMVRGYASPADVTSLTSDETRLFAGTKSGDVLVSTDSGIHWLSIRHDLPASPVSVFLVPGDTILAILGRDSIYRSSMPAASPDACAEALSGWQRTTVEQQPEAVIARAKLQDVIK